MRLGQNEEAYKQLETCFNNGFQDSATKNSLKLMDSYKNFVTFKTPTTILKLNKKEADLLHPYFESEMQRAIATYEKKYQIKLEHPVQVEVYPDHEDFAVRTLGMPGLGALGVTFGYAIAMDSPSGRKPGSFHWASTLWHEMSHVFTLTMTNHRVPRWFTEGMAVHEETAASPEWGDRLGPDEITAIKEQEAAAGRRAGPRLHPSGDARARSWSAISRPAASATTSPRNGAGTRSSPCCTISATTRTPPRSSAKN